MTWPVSLLRRAFAGAAVAWFGALPMASLAASQPHPSAAVYLCSFVVYLTGSLLCHQRPERSFFLWGSQMPVCARCTGIYVGAAVAAIVAGFLAAPNRGMREGGSSARLALVVAALPTLASLVYEWTTGQTPANWIRATAGVPIGVVVAWIVCRLGLSPSGDEVN
jgi:uncharacterized membrane protein